MGFQKKLSAILSVTALLLPPPRICGQPPWWTAEMEAAAVKEREKEEEYERNRVLSPRAAALKNILKKLKTKPHSSVLQAEYIKYFPKNRKDFDALFGCDNSEYNDKSVAPRPYERTNELRHHYFDYIPILCDFKEKHIPAVCEIVINIAKESSAFEVDEYGEIRRMMEDLLFKHTEIFRKKLFSLPPSERATAVRFAIRYIYWDEQFPEFFAKLRKDNDFEFIAIISDAIKWGAEVDTGCSCVLVPPDATNYIMNVSSVSVGSGCKNH